MGLERAGAWVAGYLAVCLALALGGVVGPGGGALALPFWGPLAVALEAGSVLRTAVGADLVSGWVFSAVALLVLALEGAALVAAWGLLRSGGRRLAGALGNP